MSPAPPATWPWARLSTAVSKNHHRKQENPNTNSRTHIKTHSQQKYCHFLFLFGSTYRPHTAALAGPILRLGCLKARGFSSSFRDKVQVSLQGSASEPARAGDCLIAELGLNKEVWSRKNNTRSDRVHYIMPYNKRYYGITRRQECRGKEGTDVTVINQSGEEIPNAIYSLSPFV